MRPGYSERGGFGARERDTQRPFSRLLFVLFLPGQEKDIRSLMQISKFPLPPARLAPRQLPAGSPVAALTVHRTVIHYRDCASLTLKEGAETFALRQQILLCKICGRSMIAPTTAFLTHENRRDFRPGDGCGYSYSVQTRLPSLPLMDTAKWRTSPSASVKEMP